MFKRLSALALALALLLQPAALAADVPAEQEMRGVWVSSVYNLDYPTKKTADADALMDEADRILDNCEAMGLNTVFLQVRPSADALYDSDLFPWSVYLTGESGLAPEDGFDPLEYWVDEAHARGLELHAWLNPYRITKGGDKELAALDPDSPAVRDPEWVVKHENNYYFDPALPEVRKLVTDGALEIVKNYDVDGIHLDDYFYPGTDFDDAASFAQYGAGFDDLGDFRRANVNALIADLDAKLHRADLTISFGVSPAGIWDNAPGNPRGSATRGRSSYSQIYCDSLYWIENSLVDYICPQIYWNIGYEIADFEILLDWWHEAVRGTDVNLYIGMAAYRSAEATDKQSVWYGGDEIARQFELLRQTGKADGTVLFRYGSLNGLDRPRAAVENAYALPAVPKNIPYDTEEAGGLLDIFSLFLYSITR